MIASNPDPEDEDPEDQDNMDKIIEHFGEDQAKIIEQLYIHIQILHTRNPEDKTIKLLFTLIQLLHTIRELRPEVRAA